MTKIITIGMNHETAPVEIRERLAMEPENIADKLYSLRTNEWIKEAFFLSTCNRVETLFTTETAGEAKASIISFLSEIGDITEIKLSSTLYTFEEMDAVRHIFRVASSLDSMVIGEPQILGQIKNAYANAVNQKTSGVILNRLMHRAFHVAKRVRTETEICEAAVSISFAAVELAKKIFHVLADKKVLLIGAGDIAELTAKHLMKHGVSSMTVSNRTFARALKVAELFNSQAVSFEEIEDQLQEVDIVITSTAATEYVITCDLVKNSLRKRRNKPLFFIDIAVPRNVQPEVNDLENIYLYDIDDLKGVIELNITHRQKEAIKAERIVYEEVFKFEKWLKTLSVVPTIISLREKVEYIIREETKKSGSSLGKLTDGQKEAINRLTHSIAEKVLSDPILFLKRMAHRNTSNTYMDLTSKLFNLNKNNRD